LTALLQKLLLFAVTFGSALLFAELAFRTMGPQGGEFVLDATLGFFSPELYVQDEVLISRLAPSVDVEIQAIEYRTRVQTNSLGVRGPELQEMLPGDLRFLLLGDSFTLGTQVDYEDTVGEKLEPILRERAGRRVSIVNAGVDGYGTQQAVGWMDRLVRDVDPDGAILLFYLGNDLRDNARLPERLMGTVVLQDPVKELTPAQREARTGWARRFQIYAHLQRHLALRAWATDFRIQEYRDEILPFTEGGNLADLLPPTRVALQRFQDRCLRSQLICIVGLIPPAYAIDTKRTAATFKAFGLDPSLSQLDGPAQAVLKVIPTGLAAVDLTPALREKVTLEPLYYTFDPHWTPAGHAQAAEGLAEPVMDEIRKWIQEKR